MVTYDFKCVECEHYQIESRKYDDRDVAGVCEECGEETSRAYATVQIRTAKLSKTFLSPTSAGGGRSGADKRAADDLRAASKLEMQALNHRPGSAEHRGLTKEARERKALKK